MNKQERKDFLKLIGLFVWILLVIFNAIVWNGNFTTWIRLSLLTVAITYTIVGLIIMANVINHEAEQYLKQEKQHLLDLKKIYSDYMRLVDEKTTEILKVYSELTDTLNITTVSNYDYLIYFKDELDWICKNRIKGKPDSFIIATCLLYSIIKNPRINISNNFKNDINYFRKIAFSINLEIGMKCAFEIISEPITYYETEYGDWAKEKHPKVEIVVPKGLIKNNELNQRILNNIYKDYQSGHLTSIMQFSNLLHLIYLNCQ